MTLIRVIGDVHAEMLEYRGIVDRDHLDGSVCLGDVGFDYSPLNGLDHTKHRIIAGNHDNYDALSPHFLGDFGMHYGMFFVRGAHSIDILGRTPQVNWWEAEEISCDLWDSIIDFYVGCAPDIVLSHDLPKSIKNLVVSDSPRDRTCHLLEELLTRHRPRLWLAGHHHISWMTYQLGTTFRVLDKLEYVDLKL